MIVLFSVCKAVLVECFVLNSCWCVSLCKLFVMQSEIIFFGSVLASYWRQEGYGSV